MTSSSVLALLGGSGWALFTVAVGFVLREIWIERSNAQDDAESRKAPDSATPDLAVPDSGTADSATPDVAVSDSAVPDSAVPDWKLVEDDEATRPHARPSAGEEAPKLREREAGKPDPEE